MLSKPDGNVEKKRPLMNGVRIKILIIGALQAFNSLDSGFSRKKN